MFDNLLHTGSNDDGHDHDFTVLSHIISWSNISHDVFHNTETLTYEALNTDDFDLLVMSMI